MPLVRHLRCSSSFSHIQSTRDGGNLSEHNIDQENSINWDDAHQVNVQVLIWNYNENFAQRDSR